MPHITKLHFYCPRCNTTKTVMYQMGQFIDEKFNIRTDIDQRYVDSSDDMSMLETYKEEINPGYEPFIYDMLKCDECGNTNLPTCDNCNGEMVHIDAGVYPAIVALNRIGLTTKFSCSGHRSLNDNDDYQILLEATPLMKKYFYVFQEELLNLTKEYPDLGQNIPSLSYGLSLECTGDDMLQCKTKEIYEITFKHYTAIGSDSILLPFLNWHKNNAILRNNCKIYNAYIEKVCNRIQSLIMEETIDEE